MTELDIRAHVTALSDAIRTTNENVALTSGLHLLTQVLVDVNRIASALEHLAKTGGGHFRI